MELGWVGELGKLQPVSADEMNEIYGRYSHQNYMYTQHIIFELVALETIEGKALWMFQFYLHVYMYVLCIVYLCD